MVGLPSGGGSRTDAIIPSAAGRATVRKQFSVNLSAADVYVPKGQNAAVSATYSNGIYV
jgi:hypothetical protein